MGRIAASWLGAAIGLSSCSSDRVELRVEWPELEDSASALVLALSEESTPSAVATEGALSVPVAFPFSAGVEEVELEVLGYDVPLSAIGLRSGPVPLGAGRSIPAPAVALGNRLTLSGHGGWSARDARASRFPGITLEQTIPQACEVAFPLPREPVRFELPGETHRAMAATVLPAGGGVALLGMRSGAAFRVDQSSVERIPELTTDQPYLGGVRDAAGELWLARPDGLLRGTWPGGFQTLPPFPGEVSHHLWLDVARTSSGVDVLALSDEGEIARFDGTRWTFILDIVEDHVRGDRATGGIRHLPDGRAVVLVPVWFPCDFVLTCAVPLEKEGGSRVLQLEGDRVTEYPSANVVAMSMTFDREGQILLGTYQGTVWRRAPEAITGEWQAVTEAPGYVWSLTPFEGGLLVGTGRGEFQPWFPRLGLCPTRSYALGHVRYAVPLEDRADRHVFALGLETDIVKGEGGNFVTILAW